MNERKKYTYPVIACFMLFILGVLAAFLFSPPGEYNSNEEKALAQHPRIYESESFDSYTLAFESFVSDQFPLRDLIIQNNNEAEMTTDVDKIIEDVYVLSSDYLFGVTYETQDSKAQALSDAIKERRTDSKLPFIYVIVPQKNLILGDSEPNVTTELDEKNLDRIIKYLSKNNISYVDCCDYMQSQSLEERSKYFYKTDMHWNEYGAYTASKYLANELASFGRIDESSVPSDSAFAWTDFTGRDYMGDFQKRFSNEVTVEEYVPFYEARDAENFVYFTSLYGKEVPRKTVVASGLDSDVLDYNKLSTYNLAYIRVDNPFAKEDKHVLILKDSYQCCMIDYLSEMFTEIDIVDPRCKDCPSFEEIAEERGIDLVLMIYHSNNISQELIDYLTL